MPTDDDSDIEDIIHRRRKKRAAKQTRLLLIAGLAVAFVLVVGCGGVLVAVLVGGGSTRVSVAGPSETREGATWTHRELFEYLRSKGVVASLKDKGGTPDMLFASFADATDPDNEAIVCKYASPSNAKDRASLKPPGKAIAWGRFVIEAEPRLLAAISKALR